MNSASSGGSDGKHGKNENHASHIYELYREFMATRPPEVLANIAICLIHQANYLIDQQLKTLESEFITQGGLRERMTRVRLANRNKQRS